LVLSAIDELDKAMNAMTWATTRVQLCKEQVAQLTQEAASPTSPDTAKSCIYPAVRHDPTKRVYRQLHRNSEGKKYYSTGPRPRDATIVADNDPRILPTATAREMGYQILDAGKPKRHHRDV
jgi:hypothetical protein